MAKRTTTVGTPLPWVEVLRRHWAHIHTVEIHHRTSPRGIFLNVPGGQLILPELVDDDDDGDDGDDGGDDGGGDDDDVTVTREGPEVAGDVAAEMFKRAWAHFETLDRKRAWYRITPYKLEDGTLVELEHVTIGGALRDDGSVDIDSWDEQTDQERTRTTEDWALAQARAGYKMAMDAIQVHMNFANATTELITATLKARSEVATKHLEHHEAVLESEVSKERAKQAGDTMRDFGERFGPAVNMYAAGYHAQHTRPSHGNRVPHANHVVEAARVLLDQLDGEAVAHLTPIVGAEVMADVFTVLRLALGESPDPLELAEAWNAVAPALFRFQGRLVKELPPELAQRLTTALQAFHMAAQAPEHG